MSAEDDLNDNSNHSISNSNLNDIGNGQHLAREVSVPTQEDAGTGANEVGQREGAVVGVRDRVGPNHGRAINGRRSGVSDSNNGSAGVITGKRIRKPPKELADYHFHSLKGSESLRRFEINIAVASAKASREIRTPSSGKRKKRRSVLADVSPPNDTARALVSPNVQTHNTPTHRITRVRDTDSGSR